MKLEIYFWEIIFNIILENGLYLEMLDFFFHMLYKYITFVLFLSLLRNMHKISKYLEYSIKLRARKWNLIGKVVWQI